MMTKKEKLELATIVANAVVEAMKASTTTPTSAKNSRKTKTSHKPYSGNVPEVSEQKLLLANKGRGTATAKYSMKLADYEPKKKNGNYIWGKKTDTIKSKHYMAMQKAYCYAVATKGKAITSDECFKLGIEVDYAEGGVYAKAKTEFKKKYAYTKMADR